MIRIGTRDSRLALWQAETVQSLLRQAGYDSELIAIKSDGDLDLITPLYAMGVQGVFTRTLDAALLSGRIDMAVHSMKDVPTQLPEGIVQAAVLQRGAVYDVLVHKENFTTANSSLTIATSSIRRQAQWLHRYPDTRFEVLRGNMQTRMDKLAASQWDGAIFAQAGLDRIGLLPHNHLVLDWMLPAPAQGAIMVVCRSNDNRCLTAGVTLNHDETAKCVYAERAFLQELMGGCATPISAWATIEGENMVFYGNITSPDGKDSVRITQSFDPQAYRTAGKKAAEQILKEGGEAIMRKM